MKRESLDAIRVNSKNSKGYFWLAKYYKQNHQNDEAVENLRKCIEVSEELKVDNTLLTALKRDYVAWKNYAN